MTSRQVRSKRWFAVVLSHYRSASYDETAGKQIVGREQPIDRGL